MTRSSKRARSGLPKSNIITSRRTRTKVNYNEHSDTEKKSTRTTRHKSTRSNTKKPTSKSTQRDNEYTSTEDESTSDSQSDDESVVSTSESEDDEEEEKRPKRRQTKNLLATLPAHKRATSIRKLTSGTNNKKATSKQKLAAASKRSVRRVNPILSSITPLRQVQSNSTPLSSYELARERLHVSAVPDSLPCREDEFDEISGYLESALQEGTGTCIYISGVPGTGKTATVLEVIRGLQYRSEQEDEDIPTFDFVEINGMKLTDANHAYSLLWDCLNHDKSKDSKKKITSTHALELLETRFSEERSDGSITVVLMDELDLLVTKKQTVMYNFFEWPSRPHSKLIVVAIANTMDLPERMLSNKIYSRIGAKRINFQAYSHQQLYEIVESRLKDIDAFEHDAVEFAARKVSAVSGDARRALDICRRAVEIVEQRQLTSATDNDNSRATTTNDSSSKSKKQTVTISVVNQAIKEMFSSPSVAFIQSCSLHQKLFLVSVMQRVRQIGLAEIEFGEVAQHHLQTCKWHHLEPPTTSDLMRICESLGQARALVVEGGRLDLGMRITLNLSEEDIIMACKTEKIIGRLLSSFSK
ncbi:P-loop containing nucleoside triphosphate hydrolase protein [Absidia repens]|uniref:Cell division control protein n=1 Tax=Absidia repens TaxID=90262 RepID=A0A1X2I4J4_9FUNG|nr:P-loop containing nucleoside triphosphate hydrolase protein [Absidia repens]